MSAVRILLRAVKFSILAQIHEIVEKTSSSSAIFVLAPHIFSDPFPAIPLPYPTPPIPLPAIPRQITPHLFAAADRVLFKSMHSFMALLTTK